MVLNIFLGNDAILPRKHRTFGTLRELIFTGTYFRGCFSRKLRGKKRNLFPQFFADSLVKGISLQLMFKSNNFHINGKGNQE